MKKLHFGMGLNLIALGLFFPGILLPMFFLDTTMLVDLGSTNLSADLLDKELSIMATVEELWIDNRYLVAALIFIFSVCIPLLKTSLLSLAYWFKQKPVAKRLLLFVTNIGKWSMADVFVVAIFLAFLSTNHAETATTQEINFAMFKLSLEISSETLSQVGEGFYYFTGYCILSLLGSQLMLAGFSHKHGLKK